MFEFLKYLQPTHYFVLPIRTSLIFPIYKELPIKVKKHLKPDDNYSTERAKELDLSWQAIQLGYIGNTKTYHKIESIPLKDNYYFIRKYFSPLWSVYILFIRLISFKNPFVELGGFLRSRDVNQSNYLSSPILYPNWEVFSSPLIKQNPKVSIVIPTLNRYDYLRDVLRDLERQNYSNFEIIVIDQSDSFELAFYESFDLEITVKYQQEKALWLARNNAIKLSTGDFILLFDDDSRVEPDWIFNHLKCIDFFSADISSGVSLSVLGGKIPVNYSFFRRSDQLDTGNVLIRKDIFEKIGLFDRQFEGQRMGDGEFGLRAHKHGLMNISNPYAKRVHLKVDSGGLREMGSWDAFRPQTMFAPRPIPSVLYFFRTYFGNYRALLELLRTVPSSVMPYRFKGNRALKVFGLLIFPIIFPIIFLQVVRSWRLASIKIKQGPLIEYL